MSGKQKPLSTAVFLLQCIKDGKIKKEQLTKRQRLICAMYLLAEQKWTHQEIGNIIGVHYVTVGRYAQEIRRVNKFILNDIEEHSWAVGLIQTAETAAANLFRAGRQRDAWAVKKELTETLQSLGFLKRKPIEIEGKMSFKALMEMVHSETTEGSEDDRRTIDVERPSGLPAPETNGNGLKGNGQNGSHH